MKEFHTDRYVLECIYKMYKSSYPGKKDASGRGTNDPYIAIDEPAVAVKVGCDAELLFGRLHFHLEQKYSYEQRPGTRVSLFAVQVGEIRHTIQFPYLASILAGLEQEHKRHLMSSVLSIFAVGVSLAALAANIFKH